VTVGAIDVRYSAACWYRRCRRFDGGGGAPGPKQLKQMAWPCTTTTTCTARYRPPPSATRTAAAVEWRVAILPFIEQVNLQKFGRRTVDSEHNKKLIAPMPMFSRASAECPRRRDDTLPRFYGKGAMFDLRKAALRRHHRRTSNTIISWKRTKGRGGPAGRTGFDPSKPLPKFGKQSAEVLRRVRRWLSAFITTRVSEKRLRR